ncbi:hypothetical protein [Bartonella henselae]|uniref:Uncharacterized protein n=1 Tax=Bartonella henselae TaxID=38323 RepID=X5M614_BARHN|nr:hypothetical protein [Bartonella henselae]ETS10967.1 hypothetical protein Q653_00437 [Bartonella henselae JK 42]ETS14657.1 hypothetical protein Q652_00570 [Bartonella henselae JK 41]KEC60351.1 hypothetical protein O97_00047 [Bartonella henselae str. Zeus]KEC60369.1 hypothetical protein O95_00417 [Bartonella henselae JK 53]MDM9983963.1 hypothetical protein [Bartonella henselae]
MKEQQQDAFATIEIIKEIHRDIKAVHRSIARAVLFTQSKVFANSRTSQFVSSQFRKNHQIDTFETEINERDAFSAIFATGDFHRDLNTKEVNDLNAAMNNYEVCAAEVIKKLRDNQTKKKIT